MASGQKRLELELRARTREETCALRFELTHSGGWPNYARPVVEKAGDAIGAIASPVEKKCPLNAS